MCRLPLLLLLTTLTTTASPGQEVVPPPVAYDTLRAHLARHAAATAPSPPPPVWRTTGTMTRGTQTTRVTTWIRHEPFGFRREHAPQAAAAPPAVMITDGRYAWNDAGPLDAVNSQLCFESAFIDGLLYLRGDRIVGGLDLSAPWHLREHDDLPEGFPSARQANVVLMRSPAGSNLQMFFDTQDQRLLEVARLEQPAITWTRYADWQRFGELWLPRRQLVGVLGHPVRTLYTIDGVEAVASPPAELFAGCPAPTTPRLQYAGRLEVVPESVPGAASLHLAHVDYDGKWPLLALVDTGATSSSLRTELAAALDLPRRGAVSFDSLSGVAMGDIGWLGRIDLGDRTALQLEAMVMRMPISPGTYSDRQPHFLVGGDILFVDSPVFDLAGGRLWFRGAPVTPLAALESKGRVLTVPIRCENGLVFVDVVINGVRLSALLDTGLPFMLHLDTRALERLGLPVACGAWLARGALADDSVAAGGQKVVALLATLPALELGGVRELDPVVQLCGFGGPADGPFEAILGMGALLPFARVGIDLSRRVLELELPCDLPAGGERELPGPGTWLGATVYSPTSAAPQGRLGLPLVVGVAPDSPAARAGLSDRDWLTRVGGEACAGRPSGAFNRRLWLRAGESIDIEWIDRDGKPHRARLP